MNGILAQAAGAVEPLNTPEVRWASLTPLLVLLGGALLLTVVGALLPRRSRFGWHAGLTVLTALVAAGSVVPLWDEVREDGPYGVVAGALAVDGFSLFLTVVICASVALTALFLDGYLRREDLQGPEGYILMLLSASGGVVMAAANDLLVMFLGLEVLSIAVYVLAGLHVRRVRSGEAALKYFLLGAFSSAIFLYGIALTYGATGTTNLSRTSAFLSANVLDDRTLLLAGTAMLLVGLGFKVAAVPFHAWAPDVYQGAPTPVVVYMASAVKAAGFAGLLRILVVALASQRLDWQPIIYGLAVLSMVVGAVLAVVQTDVKRMLAYSSISHAGFILVGVQAATRQGISAALFYLAAYTFMVAGSFGVVSLLGRRGDGRHRLADYQGLGRREPVLALLLVVFLLAQAGVPLTGGFLAKFYVIQAAVDARSYWLALTAMLSSVISAYLYLRIVLAMYAGDDDEEATEVAPRRSRIRVPAAAAVALTIALVGTVGLGLVPDPLTNTSRDAIPALVSSGG